MSKTFHHVSSIQSKFPVLERDDSGKFRVYRNPETGKEYPSITTVIKLLTDAYFREWRNNVGELAADDIMQEAMKRGTYIHKLCEDYLNNKKVKVDMFHSKMWKSLEPELNKINNIHCLETPMFSDALETAGTPDCIAVYEGALSVIDFKTSKTVKSLDEIDHYFLQCAAGSVMFTERTGIDVYNSVIIMGVDDYRPIVFKQGSPKRDYFITKFKELRQSFKETHGV